jgi:hypothetical protein
MRQETFHAGVQYNDFTGSAAADEADMKPISSYLEQKGLIREKEFLVGLELSSGVNRLSLTALVAPLSGYDNLQAALESGQPLDVREIQLDLDLNEFLGFFKSFNITLSRKGSIEGRDIAIHE